MTLELRPVDRSEAEAFVRTTYLSFGGVPPDERLARGVARFEPDFALAVFDRGRIVATASAYPFEITLPAGTASETLPVLACPGVTQVGVIATHRRQGLLTRLMERQVRDYRERGYPFSVLLASESSIYGRYGYGPAQFHQALEIPRSWARFTPEGDALAATGRMRFVDPDEAAKLLPSVHERLRRARPGELNRTPLWWSFHLKDPEADRGGGGARLYAVHESHHGEADGWVSYRIFSNWGNGGLPQWRVEVHDLVAEDPAVRAALWRLVLNIDLVEEMGIRFAPLDESLRWLLADSRRVRTTEVADHLWLRIVDVTAALSARGYGSDERLTLEVTAPATDPGAGGRFVLEPAATSGSCRPALEGEKTQLVIGLADLGAVYLGGVAPSALARAGRVTQLQPGAVAAADRVFASPVAPFCSMFF